MPTCLKHKKRMVLTKYYGIHEYSCTACAKADARVYKEKLHALVESLPYKDVIALHEMLTVGTGVGE